MKGHHVYTSSIQLRYIILDFFFLFLHGIAVQSIDCSALLDSLYWVKRIEPSGGDASNESQVHQYYMHVVSLLVIALTS
jgi:hypothetical protein